MITASTQIRIDPVVKKQASALFSKLGLDMSGAVNIFLRQCILHGGLPFSVAVPNYNRETLEAMEEARAATRDSSIIGYDNVEALESALNED